MRYFNEYTETHLFAISTLEGTASLSKERERENSLLFRGYRYALRDQDTTWPAAYDSVRRGYDEGRSIYMGFSGMVTKVRSPVWCEVVFLLVLCTRRGGVSLVEVGRGGRGWTVCCEGSWGECPFASRVVVSTGLLQLSVSGTPCSP